MTQSQLCIPCSQIQPQTPFDTQKQFPHLHPFATNEPDEFLIFNYYICSHCHQLWQESNSTYNQDRGWHWEQQKWATFIEQYRDQIEAPSPKTAVQLITWSLNQTRPFDLSPPFRL